MASVYIVSMILAICLGRFGLGRGDEVGQEDRDKRLLLSDPQVFQAQLEEMQRRIQALEARGNVQQVSQGAVYTIWGKRDCPNVNGTKIIYSGITGGGMFDQTGNGVTTLCLPHDPESLPADFPTHSDAYPYAAYIFGAEYQFGYKNIDVNDDVPCAVCHAQTSSSVLMIPAKRTCPGEWMVQYNGFLSAERYDHTGADYICVALYGDYFEGTRGVNADGRLIFPVRAKCGSLPCPPYTENQYVSCVVCTK